MDPRFNVYVTFIPDETDDVRDVASTGSGNGQRAEPSRESGLKKSVDVPNMKVKARRRSGGGGGNARSTSVK